MPRMSGPRSAPATPTTTPDNPFVKPAPPGRPAMTPPGGDPYTQPVGTPRPPQPVSNLLSYSL